jgi:hypothetical protein
MKNEQLTLNLGDKQRNVLTLDKAIGLHNELQKWMNRFKSNVISRDTFEGICISSCGFVPKSKSIRQVLTSLGLRVKGPKRQREFNGRTTESLAVIVSKILVDAIDKIRKCDDTLYASLERHQYALNLIASHRSAKEALDAFEGKG